MTMTRHIITRQSKEAHIRILNEFIGNLKVVIKRDHDPMDIRKLGELKYAKRCYRKVKFNKQGKRVY